MYKFANQSEVKISMQVCDEIIKKVQNEVREYFTFDIKLIGSGEKRLVMQNGDNGEFDLDYNLILQRDKQNLINNPKEIKKIFESAFNKIVTDYGFDYASNNTSVLTIKFEDKKRFRFSFDVAILVEDNSGAYHKLVFDKKTNRYIWNKVAKSNDFIKKFQKVKEDGKWLTFKNRYKELKNQHLKRGENTASLSIFLETLNEF